MECRTGSSIFKSIESMGQEGRVVDIAGSSGWGCWGGCWMKLERNVIYGTSKKKKRKKEANLTYLTKKQENLVPFSIMLLNSSMDPVKLLALKSFLEGFQSQTER